MLSKIQSERKRKGTKSNGKKRTREGVFPCIQCVSHSFFHFCLVKNLEARKQRRRRIEESQEGQKQREGGPTSKMESLGRKRDPLFKGAKNLREARETQQEQQPEGRKTEKETIMNA